MNLSGEQDVHAERRIAFAKDHHAGPDFALNAVASEPQVVLL